MTVRTIVVDVAYETLAIRETTALSYNPENKRALRRRSEHRCVILSRMPTEPDAAFLDLLGWLVDGLRAPLAELPSGDPRVERLRTGVDDIAEVLDMALAESPPRTLARERAFDLVFHSDADVLTA